MLEDELKLMALSVMISSPGSIASRFYAKSSAIYVLFIHSLL